MVPPWEADDPDAGHPRLHRPRLPRHQAAVRPAARTMARSTSATTASRCRCKGFLFVPPGSRGLGARVRRPDGVHPPHVHLRARARPAAALGALRPRRHRVPAAAADRLARGHPPGRELRVGAAGAGGPARQGAAQLARDDPPTWKQVVRGHSDVIIGWAVSDNEFFERVEDIVTFRTTRGPLSLPEYLEPDRRQPLLRHARAGLAAGAVAGRGPRRAGHRCLVVLGDAVPGEVRPAPSRGRPGAAGRRGGAAAAAGPGRRRSPPLLDFYREQGIRAAWRRSSRPRRRP